MGYIGSKSGITKLSELENDVGYTGSKGTVKEFRVSGGKFSDVTLSTVYPKFNVPVTTSQIENDLGYGKGILKDIKRNKTTVRNPDPSRESDWESTLENPSTANIFVPTKTSQLSNNDKPPYTTVNGTITKITEYVGRFSRFGPVTGGSASFSAPAYTSQLDNHTGIKTKTNFNEIYQVHYINTKNNGFFTINDDYYSSGTNPDLYFIRFGNIRMIFSNSTVQLTLTATSSHYVSNFLHIIQPKDYPKAPQYATGGDIICGIGSGDSDRAGIGNVHGIITIYDKGLNAYGFDHAGVTYVNLKFYAVWIAGSVYDN